MLHIAQWIAAHFSALNRSHGTFPTSPVHSPHTATGWFGRSCRSHRFGNWFTTCALSCLLLPFWSLQALPQSPGKANLPPSNKGTIIIEQAIHDYILAHPEVLIESLERAKAKAQEEVASVVKSNILVFKNELVHDPNAPVLGNPRGDVTIVEFFDYRCPYCRQVEPWLQTLIKEDPGVRVVHKEYPILGPESVYAAYVALAAWKQGRHAQFHNAMMAKRGNLDQPIILEVAEAAGLDIGRIKDDMKNPEIASEVELNMGIGRELRLTGTPAFVVGTVLVPGATDLETLRSMVSDARHRDN